MTAIGYARVSTASQQEEGISLEAQEHRIQGWCQANGYQLQHVFIEARSAARADNRPELQVALSQACHSKAALVVYSLSRLARSTKDALLISERLDRAGADLVSLSERIDSTSPMGKMVFRLLAAINEFEKDQLSERTRLAMAHLRQTNRRISTKIPLGYDLAPDGQTLVENAAEQATVKNIVALRQKALSLVQIVRHLEQAGIPTKNGRGLVSLDRCAYPGPATQAPDMKKKPAKPAPVTSAEVQRRPAQDPDRPTAPERHREGRHQSRRHGLRAHASRSISWNATAWWPTSCPRCPRANPAAG